MTRYRKKPVVIEARQFLEDNGRELAQWCGGKYYLEVNSESVLQELLIHTLEGVMEARPGDYIVKGVQGEFYPCRGDIFELTYEPVAEGDE